MKTKLLIVAILGLAACGEQSTNEVAPASSVSQINATDVAPQAHKLKSQDGKVNVAISGVFVDKLNDSTMLPENIQAEDLLFLQQNSDNETIIYAAKYGKVTDSKAYFSQLEKAIRSDKSLSNVNFETKENERVAYHFSHADSKDTAPLNESCIVEVASEQTYVVCANSTNEDLSALDAIVNQTVITK